MSLKKFINNCLNLGYLVVHFTAATLISQCVLIQHTNLNTMHATYVLFSEKILTFMLLKV